MSRYIAVSEGFAEFVAEGLSLSTPHGQTLLPLSSVERRIFEASSTHPESHVEVERRFLVAERPSLPEGKRLKQGYLLVSTDVALRIRQMGSTHKMTLKKGSGLARLEVELELDEARAHLLWPLCGPRLIDKTRYKIPDGAGVLELDLYHGRHEGLQVVEREFPTEAEAHAWTPPPWAGPELTDDGRYTNAALATADNLSELLGKS